MAKWWEVYKLRRYYLGEVRFVMQWLRYRFLGGTVYARMRDRIEYTISEEAFYSHIHCHPDTLVGYWAYGHFDPSMPYQGQKKVKVISRGVE